MQNFTLNITGTYTREEIPPRCRKPRPVTYDASAQIEIQALTQDQAPVAFRIKALRGHEDFEATNDIRTASGRLYAPYLPYSRQTEPTIPGDSNFPQNVEANRWDYSNTDSQEAFTQKVEEHYNAYVIIDGAVWVETREPYYTVATFGFGNNHGGTGLMVSGNSGNTFRADEYADALACAIETARDRGDTKDVARFTNRPEEYRAIEVLIPDAVTLVTVSPAPKEVRDLRFDYEYARGHLKDAETPDAETKAFAEVTELREKIVALGYAPIAPRDQNPYEARHLATGGIA